MQLEFWFFGKKRISSPGSIQDPWGWYTGMTWRDEGYRASRCGKEGLSRSCSECSRKPWVHSTCASDRREPASFSGIQQSCFQMESVFPKCFHYTLALSVTIKEEMLLILGPIGGFQALSAIWILKGHSGGTTGSSGSLLCGAREVRSQCLRPLFFRHSVYQI